MCDEIHKNRVEMIDFIVNNSNYQRNDLLTIHEREFFAIYDKTRDRLQQKIKSESQSN